MIEYWGKILVLLMSNLTQLSDLIRTKREESGQSLNSIASVLKIRADLVAGFEKNIDPNLSFYHYSHLKRICHLLHIPFEKFQQNINTEFSLSNRQRQIPKIKLTSHKKSNRLLIILIFGAALGAMIFLLAKTAFNYKTIDPNKPLKESAEEMIEKISLPKIQPHNILDK